MFAFFLLLAFTTVQSFNCDLALDCATRGLIVHVQKDNLWSRGVFVHVRKDVLWSRRGFVHVQKGVLWSGGGFVHVRKGVLRSGGDFVHVRKDNLWSRGGFGDVRKGILWSRRAFGRIQNSKMLGKEGSDVLQTSLSEPNDEDYKLLIKLSIPLRTSLREPVNLLTIMVNAYFLLPSIK